MSWHRWMLGSICECCDCAGESFTSAGGRRVRLCNACANEFHAWLIRHRAYYDLIGHNARHDYLTGLVASGQQVSEEDWFNYRHKDRTIKAELFHFTGVWIDENKAKAAKQKCSQPLADDQL